MSYNITKTDGSKLVTVEDGSVNAAACDITLIGKNYSGYGQVVNQNLVKMLENFANIKQPSTPLIGQLWYDTVNKKLKIYTGSEFKGLPVVESSQVEPTTLKQGDFWYNESQKKLYYFTGATFTLIGPQYSDLVGNSSVVPAVLKDTDGFSHYVLAHQVQNYSDPSRIDTVSITSFDPFTIDSSTPVDGFEVIKQGLNIYGTDNNGISSEDSTGSLLWGTSSDSLRLGGYVSGDYVRRNDPRFESTLFINAAGGLAINSNNFKIFIDEAAGAQLTSDLTQISFNATVGANTLYNVFNVNVEDGLAIHPSTDAGQTTNIGASSKRFNNVYANTFNGALIGDVTGNARTATSATTWITSRTLTLGGDLSGSVSINGSSNVTLNATVVGASTATTAQRWTSSRTLTLSGDLSGSVTFDGSTNMTLTATVGVNTIALGTDTVGTYVARAQALGWGINDGSNNVGTPITEVERGFFQFQLASTSTSIANTLVFRNASGNFAANDITASSITAGSIVKSGTSGVGNIGSDSNKFGEIHAVTFSGTATSAFYADLAEKYLPDANYEPGTVLMLGGTAEVTICNTYESEKVLGVVSTDPAYLMNSGLEGGVAIALKGRVPVKVTGSISKGDILVSSNIPGHAEARRYGHKTNPWAVIGQALQDFNGEAGLIEMFVI
jgi:hypothetical protein